MDVSQALAPAMANIETARMRETAGFNLLKDAIEFEGALALQLIPEPPPADPSSPLGQTINTYA